MGCGHGGTDTSNVENHSVLQQVYEWTGIEQTRDKTWCTGIDLIT